MRPLLASIATIALVLAAAAASWWLLAEDPEATPSAPEHAGLALAPIPEPAARTPAPGRGAMPIAPPPATVEERLRPLARALQRAIARAEEARARAEEPAREPGRVTERGAGPADGAPPDAPPDDNSDTPTPWHVDRDGIQGAVRSTIPELRECYEEWLALNPGIQGRLVVTFRIEPDADDPGVGRVTQASIAEGELGNQFLEGCILASLSVPEFVDPPPEGTAVTYPFTFTSDDDEGEGGGDGEGEDDGKGSP